MVLHTKCQKEPSGVFCDTAVQIISGNTGGKVPMLEMTACGNFALPGFFGRFFGRYLRNIQQK